MDIKEIVAYVMCSPENTNPTGNTFSVSGYTPSRTPSFKRTTVSEYIPEENAYYAYYYVENSDLVTSAVCKFLNSNNALIHSTNMISGSWSIGGLDYNYRAKCDISSLENEIEVRQTGYVNNSVGSTTTRIYPQKKLMLDGKVAGYFKISTIGNLVIDQFVSLIYTTKSCYWLDSWKKGNPHGDIMLQRNQTTGDFWAVNNYFELSMMGEIVSLWSNYLPRKIEVHYPNGFNTLTYEYDRENPHHWQVIFPENLDGNGLYVNRTDYWYISEKAIYTNGTQEINFALWDEEGVYCPLVNVSLNTSETGLYTLTGVGGPAYVKINNQIKRGTVYTKKGQELVPVILK